jgi:D-amino peptidase
MRVVIFCDMEGISCIEMWEQVTGGTALYAECRKLYTNEMNAAVRGAKTAGATDIVVVDCHGAGGAYNFKSFVPDLLEPGAEYVFGYARLGGSIGTDSTVERGQHYLGRGS